MASFLRKVLALVVLQAVIGAVLWWRYQVDENAYAAATRDKHALLASTKSPRVLLVGGSNVALGLSAEKLSQALNMPTINMGVHANLGRDFMLAEVQDHLGADDVVVLSFEYQLFGADPAPNTQMQVVEARPQSRAYVSLRGAAKFLDDGLILLGERARRAVVPPRASVPPYSRSSFNAYGDAVAHHGLPPRRPLSPFYFERLTEENIQRGVEALAAFTVAAKGRKARVFYAFPPLPQSIATKHAKDIAQIVKGLDDSPVLDILNRPWTYPDACFFDTAYHLTDTCTHQRTAALAQKVSAALAKSLAVR